MKVVVKRLAYMASMVAMTAMAAEDLREQQRRRVDEGIIKGWAILPEPALWASMILGTISGYECGNVADRMKRRGASN